MALWKATQNCYVLGVEMQAGQKIELDEDNEKTLKLGKFAEKVTDKITGKEYLSSFQHLEKVRGEKMDPDKAVGIADGMIVYPQKKPFNLLGAAN